MDVYSSRPEFLALRNGGYPRGSLEAGAVSAGQAVGGGLTERLGTVGRVCGRGVMSPPGSLRLELKKGLGVTRTLCCVFTFLDGRSWSALACWREGSRRGLGSSPKWAEAGLAWGAVLEERAGRQGGGPGDEGAGADGGSHAGGSTLRAREGWAHPFPFQAREGWATLKEGCRGTGGAPWRGGS